MSGMRCEWVPSPCIKAGFNCNGDGSGSTVDRIFYAALHSHNAVFEGSEVDSSTRFIVVKESGAMGAARGVVFVSLEARNIMTQAGEVGVDCTNLHRALRAGFSFVL